jgi:hypothetical protein
MTNSQLSSDLQPIYELELTLGNAVARVDRPAGTECPLAVIFRDPLHFGEIHHRLKLPASVKEWNNADPHYPSEAGFYSTTSKHALAGPAAKSI